MNSKEHYFESKIDASKGNSIRNHSNEEKIRLVRDVISREITNNDLYKRESIDINLLNKCNRDFIETERGRFVHNVRSEVTSFEMNHIKNQNMLLKQFIAELSHENDLLKRRLNGLDKAAV